MFDKQGEREKESRFVVKASEPLRSVGENIGKCKNVGQKKKEKPANRRAGGVATADKRLQPSPRPEQRRSSGGRFKKKKERRGVARNRGKGVF